MPTRLFGLFCLASYLLSSFQTSYAASRARDYSLFFLGFISAAITSRLLWRRLVTSKALRAA